MKHLFAKWVDGQIYRDHANDYVHDGTLQEILNGKLMPDGYECYHYSSERQWEAVLALPEYKNTDMPVWVEAHIANSKYGICRRCRMQPADGLFKGRFPIHNDWGALLRTSPYKGYVCEQCAQNLEEETTVRGVWLREA